MRVRHPLHMLTLLAALAALAALGAVARAATDAGSLVHVTSHVDADSVTVGQRFTVTQEFTYPDSLRMLPPAPPKMEKSRVLSEKWTQTPSSGTLTRRATWSVITLDLDGATIPSLDVDFVTPSGDTVVARTDELDVPVRFMAADSSALSPLKEPWEAPRSLTLWIVSAVGALVLAALAVWWWRRRRHRVEEEEPEERLPADYVALTELTRIEKLGLLDAGEFKHYYTLVVDAVRRYLEARFDVDAMDRTSFELLDDLRRRRIEPPGLETLLGEADLVKFAKYVPTREAGTAAMRAAREVVAKTALRPAAADTLDAQADSNRRAAG